MRYIAVTFIMLTFWSLSAQDGQLTKDLTQTEAATETASINWMSWSEAAVANKTDKKKIFIDVYTDWCGWCKKMDKTTFQDPAVIKELNDNFYAIKLDAEMKEDIDFNGSKFSFVKQGRKGSHQLAYALLDGRMGYPAFVILDENFHRVMLTPGYQKVEQLVPQLEYTSTEAYKTQNFQDFAK